MLNDFQIQIIENDIKSSGVYMKNLSYDMLDHLCCSIEEKMIGGISFEKAYESSKVEFAPNGLGEIQEETKVLLTLNSKKMKKVKNVIGILAVITFITGVVFGKLHIIGSGAFTVLGSFLMVIYLITQLKTKYLEEPTKQIKTLQVLTVITSIFLISGLCFYKMHWPGAKILFSCGLLILITVIAPLTLKNFQSIIKYLSGPKVAIGIIFLGVIMLIYANTGNSTNYYRTMAINDDSITSKSNKLEELNSSLRLEKKSDLSDKIMKTVSSIEELKLKMIELADYKETYTSKNKNLRYLINNDIWTERYLFEDLKTYQSSVFNSIKNLQLQLNSKNIKYIPFISTSHKKWEEKNFKNKMLFGIFMYLDQLQYDLRRMEREVLIYL